VNWQRIVALCAAVILGAVACTSPDRPSVQAEALALPSPLRSPTAAIAATIEQLQNAVLPVPSRLVDPVAPYRPSEPESLLQVPRVVLRADVADPQDGHVLIYGADGASEAADYADDLAAYLGSGFGQVNFPVDAQFSVAVVGDTVVFTWRSRRGSSDPDLAVAVYDAIASVGRPVEVHK
jgi:hypothetical protein